MSKEEYISITNLKTLQSCHDFLKIMTDFFFDIILATGKNAVSSIYLNDARTWLQMMFSKGVHFDKALYGIDYKKDYYHLNIITDHTVLFSLVRNLFESYVVFRLLYTIPTKDTQKELVYNLFVHAGLQERFDNTLEETKKNNPEWAKDQQEQMDACKQIIYNNELYSRSNNIRETVDNSLKSNVNKYRYRFTDEDKMAYVNFEKYETLKILGINSSLFEGMYHYFSQMTHPSYLSIDQFSIAYNNPEKGSIMLASTATRYAIAILSLFIREYAKLFSEVDNLYYSHPHKYLISLYGNIVIKDANTW